MSEDSEMIDLSVGKAFNTFDEFLSVLEQRETKYGERWVKGTGGRTIESANQAIKDTQRHYNPSWAYQYVNFKCVHGGTFKSRAKQRKSSSMKQGCPAIIQLAARRKLNALVVSKVKLEHNHELSPPVCSKVVVDKKPTEQELAKMVSLRQLGVSCSRIRSYMLQICGKAFTRNDICNMTKKHLQQQKSEKEGDTKENSENISIDVHDENELDETHLQKAGPGSEGHIGRQINKVQRVHVASKLTEELLSIMVNCSQANFERRCKVLRSLMETWRSDSGNSNKIENDLSDTEVQSVCNSILTGSCTLEQVKQESKEETTGDVTTNYEISVASCQTNATTNSVPSATTNYVTVTGPAKYVNNEDANVTNQEVQTSNLEVGIPVASLQVSAANLEATVTNLQVPASNLEIPVTNLVMPTSNQEIHVTNLEVPVTNFHIPVTNLEVVNLEGSGSVASIQSPTVVPFMQQEAKTEPPKRKKIFVIVNKGSKSSHSSAGITPGQLVVHKRGHIVQGPNGPQITLIKQEPPDNYDQSCSKDIVDNEGNVIGKLMLQKDLPPRSIITTRAKKRKVDPEQTVNIVFEGSSEAENNY